MAITNFDQAVDVWVAKETGVYIRQIAAKYDVDPRRIYEILEEEKFEGSRLVAWERLKSLKPSYHARSAPDVHVKRHKIVKRNDDQGELF